MRIKEAEAHMQAVRKLDKRTPVNANSRVKEIRWIHYVVGLVALAGFLISWTLPASGQAIVFGPKTYARTAGSPNIFVESFNVANTNSSFTLIVQNGDADGNHRVSSGEVLLNGVEVVKQNDFNQQVDLIQKTVTLQENNTLRVGLQSAPESFLTISIRRDPIPILSISTPANAAIFSAQPITVEGTIDTASAQVTVNGVNAAVNSGRFVANNVPLPRDGNNLITAIGTAPGGNTGQASITVTLDTMAPTIVIESPSNGFATADSTIAVTGVVTDVITANPAVLVNGISASVNNGTFIAMGIPLDLGANQITATAQDGVGNQSLASIAINRAEQPGLRVRIVSGQAQTGVVNTSLPSPLRVEVDDPNGNPISNRQVLFQVSRGDGTIKNFPPLGGQTGQRTLSVQTDVNGEAQIGFTLGSRTGAGNNRVQAGVAGGLSPVEFCATATSGAPDRIAIVPITNQQTGVVGQPLGDQFACVVLDRAGNPVSGVPVLFRVTEGGGSLGGNPTVAVTTGVNGIARALLTLGPAPGTQNNVVAANYQGQTDPPILFVASGRVQGLLGNTTFSGLVLDNGDRPLRNARAVILGTSRFAFTDTAGHFLITNVPPGPQRLFIEGGAIVDGQGRIFPDLEFDLNVIGGIENSLPMPIYLPPLSTQPQSMATITGPVTTTTVLRMPGVPEATLTLAPGTIVSNHAGPASASNPITVRLSRVNNDRVPMPPPNGSVFMLAGTVQPAGTHFSPPARVCVPNAGMPPGAEVDVFSFDHDIGQFLSIGPATVSEDGSLLCSNLGFGIHKAGWYGCSPPPPPTTEPKNCRVVSVTANPNPVCIPPVFGPPISDEVVITATTDPGDKTVTWGGDMGATPVISGNTLRTRYGTPGQKVVTATCEQSTRMVTVNVVQVEIEVNNTPAENDDVVQLMCERPAQRFRVQSRGRVIGNPENEVNVTLTNPDGRLRFPAQVDGTRNLTLPRNGDWVAFEISGETQSGALNDAEIVARVNGAGGPMCGKEDVTVFWFDQAMTGVAAGGNYAVAGGRFTAVGGNAVNYSVQARIRPDGVDCTVPQVTNLRIGIMQNVTSTTRASTWDTPTITWNPGVAAGTTVTVPTSIRSTLAFNGAVNDSEATVAPLYDQPGKGGTLDANSLKPPIGCANGGAATSFDTPSLPTPATFSLPARTAGGAVVGTISWTVFVNVTANDSFVTWTVTFNTTNNEICALRQRGWALNIDSAAAGVQRAAPDANDAAPNATPVTAPPFINQVGNDPANRTTGGVGAATTTFTR